MLYFSSLKLKGEILRKVNMKCLICNADATSQLKIDIDVAGLKFCDKHKDDVRYFLYILSYEGEDAAMKWLKSCQNKFKREAKLEIK